MTPVKSGDGHRFNRIAKPPGIGRAKLPHCLIPASGRSFFEISNLETSMADGFTRWLQRQPGPTALDQATFVVLLIAAGLGYCLPPVNIDEGAILDFAGRMLDGQVLYRDLVDVNPPMTFLLNLVPASLTRTTMLPAPAVITGCVLLVPSLSCRATLRFVNLMSERTGARWLIAVAVIYVVILYPGVEFSQREHLLLLTTLPYLYNLHCFIASRTRRSTLARLLEIAPFAVMVAQKPHFALVPAVLECVAWAVARRMPRIELALFVVLGAAYLIATALFYPVYLERIVPLAEHLYGIANPQLVATTVLGSGGFEFVVSIALLSGVYLLFLRRLWLKLLLISIAVFYLEAALQLKDWSYHFLPARALTILAVVACTATLLAERPKPARHLVARQIVEAIGLSLFLFIGVGAMFNANPDGVTLPYLAQRGFANDDWASVRRIVAEYARNGRVMWLSQYNDGPADALTYARAHLISPTMSLWMLPALYTSHTVRNGVVVYHDPSRMSADEKWLWGAISEAFVRQSPSVIVDVTDDPGMRPGRFDYLEYFSTNPRFRSCFSSYRQIYANGAVRVYVRSRLSWSVVRG
ncbi:MAG TPA: hypothetical protein VMB81_24295 [Candidatus Sulfotelmatobacter sp.]|nr:hypothetical protein [Candidatus Sulfotelmatobacter sp.]